MAKSTEAPEEAERYGWRDGDLQWQAEGEGEPLFTDEELAAILAANPTVTKTPGHSSNQEGGGGGSESGGESGGEAASMAKDDAPIPLDPDLQALAEGAPSNIVQQFYEEQAQRNQSRPWLSPPFE